MLTMPVHPLVVLLALVSCALAQDSPALEPPNSPNTIVPDIPSPDTTSPGSDSFTDVTPVISPSAALDNQPDSGLGQSPTVPGFDDDGGRLLDPECLPPVYQYSDSQGVAIPPLGSDEKPNFIVILTDDQGWDDIGLHNPDWVNTPNLDKFIRSGTLFDNFYTSPQCAPSRAMLLTGRDYPRTGTLLVNAGYDSIHKSETTLGEFMSAAGYNTAQFGKWHNGQEMGYEPLNRGFKESWNVPISLAVHQDPIFVHNGNYELTKGWLEDLMMDKLLTYLDEQKQSSKPFLAYYATHSIHAGGLSFKGNLSDPWSSNPLDQGESPRRPVPPAFKAKYYNSANYANLPDATKDAFAMLEYLDAALGRLFEYLEHSPLGKSTYVMIGGDNGSALLGRAEKEGASVRLPSKMQGAKSLVLEGGVRNFWAVRGPGVEAGVVDSTLLDLTDVFPTIVDLTGQDLWFVPHMPWDGNSFKNLLIPHYTVAGSSSDGESGSAAASSYRGTSLATPQQADRIVFSLSTHCWDYDALPALGTDRQVIRPQSLTNYMSGGRLHTAYSKQSSGWLSQISQDPPGFQPCMAARWKEYKWIGLTNKVYRFTNGSHVELPCHEVTGPEAAQVAGKLSAAARSWWSSINASPHSFVKPTSYLGLGNGSVTNMLPQTAKSRTEGRVKILANGVAGFSKSGDQLCMDTMVMRPGSYAVTMFYLSKQQARFRLSVGSFPLITKGRAQSIRFQLPAQPDRIRGMHAGTVTLPLSGTQSTEACLTLLHSQNSSAPVFNILVNIQFTWQPSHNAGSNTGRQTSARHAPAQRHNKVANGKRPGGRTVGERGSLKRVEPWSSRLQLPEDRIQVAVPVRDTVRSSRHQWVKELAEELNVTHGDPWTAIRKKYGWPEGQGTPENLFSPYETEMMPDEAVGCDTCALSI